MIRDDPSLDEFLHEGRVETAFEGQPREPHVLRIELDVEGGLNGVEGRLGHQAFTQRRHALQMADRVGEGGAAEVERLRVEDDVVDGARPTALVDVAARARKAAGRNN